MSVYTNYTINANDGALNGTTPVTIVAAPSTGHVRTVRSIFIANIDTGAVTLTLTYASSSNRTIWSGTLQVGDTLQFDENDFLVLDATTKSITAVMSAA